MHCKLYRQFHGILLTDVLNFKGDWIWHVKQIKRCTMYHVLFWISKLLIRKSYKNFCRLCQRCHSYIYTMTKMIRGCFLLPFYFCFSIVIDSKYSKQTINLEEPTWIATIMVGLNIVLISKDMSVFFSHQILKVLTLDCGKVIL